VGSEYVLVCKRELGVPTFVQAASVRQEGAKFEIVRIDGGHMSWSSKTDEIVEAVRRAAWEGV